MRKPLRALIVDDSKADAELLLIELENGGYDPTSERVDTSEAMSEALDRHTWDIVLADYVMPDFSGLAALQLLQARGIDLPFIVVSGQIGEDIAVATMKAGASDYILKGRYARLVPAVERELREAEARRKRRTAEEERDRLAEQLRGVNEQLVVSSLRIRRQAEEASRKAAETDAILESVAEGLVIYGPGGQITRMNEAAAELLGYPPEERDMPLRDRAALQRASTPSGEPFPVEEMPVSRALRGETVRGVVMRTDRHAGAKPAWFSVSAAPIRSAEGVLLGAVATFTDVTALHERG